jgi:hypothetical protein
MASPALVSVTGTSTAYWFCDPLQVPFQVGIAAIVSGAAGTYTVDATFDNISGVQIARKAALEANGEPQSSCRPFGLQ